jgi:hypothetical protein
MYNLEIDLKKTGDIKEVYILTELFEKHSYKKASDAN